VPRRRNKASALHRYPAGRISAVLLLVLVGAGVLGTAQAARAAQAGPDVNYLIAVHESDLAIVAAGKAAKTDGRSSCVRKVGARLESDHRRLAEQSRVVAEQLGLSLPTSPSAEQRRSLNAVAAKAGTSGYDAAWLAWQRREHRHVLSLINSELAAGSQPEIKSLAAGARPVIRMHQSMIGSTCQIGTESPSVPTGDGGQLADAERRRTQAALVFVGLGLVLLASKHTSARWRAIGVAGLVLGAALLSGGQPGDAGDVPEGGLSAPEREAAVPPIRLALPGLVDAPVVPVAANREGALDVPKSPTTVGWWAAGAAPGSAGGTVLLAGHVDSARSGRGVFAALWGVPLGARVTVTAGDGTVYRYRIVARRIYRQDALPANLFRAAAKPRLALITCIRSYDRSARRYSHNLVLYAVPTAQKPEP
jgi:predicted outer membrane protein